MKIYSRSNPFLSRIKERKLLSGISSTKKTYHVVLDTSDWKDAYVVGDSVGVMPSNDPKEVDLILEDMDSGGEELVADHRTGQTVSIRQFLTTRANLMKINRSMLTLIAEKGCGSSPFILSLLSSENKEKLMELINTRTLREWIHQVPITATELAKVAMPLLPRFYSIANSSKVFPDEIHLLVNYVQYHLGGQERYGVGSRFLCDLAEVDSTHVPIYIQPSNHFTLPSEPDTSIILVGPGTGVAPYRAFLQERIATQSQGRNWLFFGERNRSTDFYYDTFWLSLEKQGRLRLDLAFSRDSRDKVYVQHKMYEQRKSLWQWISQGAFFYVCGDAENMAKQVDDTLQRIVKEEGQLSEEGAIEYVKNMRKEKRYLVDVY